jgi:ferric-dicitrate binding protein FerR (iron transport regulator)
MRQKHLHTWLNDEATPADLEELQHMPEFSSYQKIDRYVKQMVLPEHPVETGLLDVKQQLRSRKKPVRVISLATMLKIAAVLVLIAASYVYLSTLPTTVSTNVAQTESVVLPDASQVVLNQNSEIEYRSSAWDNNRMVSLKGEAFFNVAKGSTFTVETGEGTVAVLGTQFNVRSVDGTFSVTCYEGLVAVASNGKEIQVARGESVTLENGAFTQRAVYVNSPYWINNESSFANAPLSQVLEEVAAIYNVNITTQNIDVTLPFTGSIAHTDLETALQGITLPLSLQYTIENDDAVIIYQEHTQE